MSETKQRITVGFQGGQVLAARVTAAELTRLTEALGGDGWFTVESEDGTGTVNLAQIVYVLVAKDEQRVGFGSG